MNRVCLLSKLNKGYENRQAEAQEDSARFLQNQPNRVKTPQVDFNIRPKMINSRRNMNSKTSHGMHENPLISNSQAEKIKIQVFGESRNVD